MRQSPPEPLDIKERIRSRAATCSDERCINMAIWFGNELAKYLWNFWRRELRAKGISWRLFLKTLSEFNKPIVEWAIKGSMNWDTLVQKIHERLELGASRVEDLSRYIS